MRVQRPTSSFAVCIRDGGEEDLEQRKLYQVVPDREAIREGYLRVIDESGEDYLYPSELFVTVKLPAAIARRLMLAPGEVATTGRASKLRLRPSRV